MLCRTFSLVVLHFIITTRTTNVGSHDINDVHNFVVATGRQLINDQSIVVVARIQYPSRKPWLGCTSLQEAWFAHAGETLTLAQHKPRYNNRPNTTIDPGKSCTLSNGVSFAKTTRTTLRDKIHGKRHNPDDSKYTNPSRFRF